MQHKIFRVPVFNNLLSFDCMALGIHLKTIQQHVKLHDEFGFVKCITLIVPSENLFPCNTEEI